MDEQKDPIIIELRKRRLMLEISQTDLGKTIGRHGAQMSGYETGHAVSPRLSVVHRWAAALGLELRIGPVSTDVDGAADGQ